MSNTDLIQPEDKKFYVMNPDPDFSPERNQEIIKRTIAKHKLMMKQRQAKFNDLLSERVDAVATYVTSMKNNKPLDTYFGKKRLAQLQGKDVDSQRIEVEMSRQSLLRRLKNATKIQKQIF